MGRRGLIDRATGEKDRRVSEVVLTEAGLAQVQAAAGPHAAFVRRMFFDGLEPELLGPLSAALDQIYDHLLDEGALPGPQERQQYFPGLRPE